LKVLNTNVKIFKYRKIKTNFSFTSDISGVAKIAGNIAIKEIFCYGRNFSLAVRSGFNRFPLRYKTFYARSALIELAPYSNQLAISARRKLTDLDDVKS